MRTKLRSGLSYLPLLIQGNILLGDWMRSARKGNLRMLPSFEDDDVAAENGHAVIQQSIFGTREEKAKWP